MLRIPCPHCGLRDYTEFRYYGDASKQRPELHDSDVKRWADYKFLFDNPKGIHREYWQHISACRQWLVVTRDTATNTVINADWPDEQSTQTEPLMGEQSHG
jgi:sarcosine oxidase subunit delta